MRWVILIIIVLAASCTTNNSETTNSSPKAVDFIISSEKNLLFYYVNPNLTIVNDAPENFDHGDITKVGYKLFYRYDVQDTNVSSVQINILCEDSTLFEDLIKKIETHLDQFTDNKSVSKNFRTWLLPLNNKPLIEVDLFVNGTRMELRIEAFRRQYI